MKTLFLVLLSIICFFVCSSYASSYWISPFGSNQNNGNSASSPFQSLSYALSMASSNDTIYCLSGMYSKEGEDVGITIDKQVSISIDPSQSQYSVIFSYADSNGAPTIFTFSGQIRVNITGIVFASAYTFFTEETPSTDSVSLYILNCNFSEGGMVSTTNLYFEGSVFSNCYTPISMSTKNTLTVVGCTFSQSGNAIVASQVQLVEISDCIFENGITQNQKGGAINLYLSNAIVQNSTFTNNGAEYGGAIYLQQSSVSIYSSSFQTNTATMGGAIYSKYTDLFLFDLVFSNCSSSSEGGALYMYDSTLYMSDIIFDDNSSQLGPDCQSSSSSIFYSDLYFEDETGNVGNCFSYNK